MPFRPVFVLSLVASAIAWSAAASSSTTIDDWLTAHPSVASALVWEFPPPLQIPRKNIELYPQKPILWWTGEISPLGVEAPLSLSSFPQTALRSTPREADVRIPDPAERLRVLSEGLQLQPIVSSFRKTSGWTLSKAVRPADIIQALPGGVKATEYGADARSWSKWPAWAQQTLRDRFTAYDAWAQNACPLYTAYAASGFTVRPAGFDAAFSSLVDLDPHPIADPPVLVGVLGGGNGKQGPLDRARYQGRVPGGMRRDRHVLTMSVDLYDNVYGDVASQAEAVHRLSAERRLSRDGFLAEKP